MSTMDFMEGGPALGGPERCVLPGVLAHAPRHLSRARGPHDSWFLDRTGNLFKSRVRLRPRLTCSIDPDDDIDAMTEGSFEGVGGIRIFTRAWRPAGQAARAWSSSPTASTRTAANTSGSPSSSSPRGSRCYALDHRGRGRSEGERFYVEKFADYVDDLATFIDDGQGARAGPAGVPARPQRRRRDRLRLRARAPGRARRPDLRELRVPGAGAGLRAGGAQGAQPPRAARARPQAEERGLLARSRRSSRR